MADEGTYECVYTSLAIFLQPPTKQNLFTDTVDTEMGEQITLFCLVLGDDPEEELFPVDIITNKTIGALKDSIKEKKPDTLSGEADKLKLWQVDISLDNNEQMEVLHKPVTEVEEGVIKTQLGGKRVLPTKRVGKCWNKVQLYEDSIHVIIERPAGKQHDCVEYPPNRKVSTSTDSHLL